MEARGTTEKGECRSLACKTMIEPNSWDLNEVKVQPSPPFTPYKFYMKFTAYCLLSTAYFPIFSSQKFLTRILLWQRLLFSVTVTWVAVWNAP